MTASVTASESIVPPFDQEILSDPGRTRVETTFTSLRSQGDLFAAAAQESSDLHLIQRIFKYHIIRYHNLIFYLCALIKEGAFYIYNVVKKGIGLIYILAFLVACSSDEDEGFSSWLEAGEEFSGGATTVFDESENAFGHAAPNLTGNKDLEFVTGNSFFRRNWVTAPSSTEDLDGLGPVFNARSCAACHFKDGRGAPPLSPEEEPLALLFRLSRPGEIEWEPIPDEMYGGQFNPKAILGLENEGSVSVNYTEIPGNLS